MCSPSMIHNKPQDAHGNCVANLSEHSFAVMILYIMTQQIFVVRINKNYNQI